MSNTTNPEDSKERKASLLSGFASIPPLDPPKEWGELTKEVWEEVGLRRALSGLSKDSPEFEQYSERLAEFLELALPSWSSRMNDAGSIDSASGRDARRRDATRQVAVTVCGAYSCTGPIARP
jgi:hypothetical protein